MQGTRQEDFGKTNEKAVPHFLATPLIPSKTSVVEVFEVKTSRTKKKHPAKGCMQSLMTGLEPGS